ncbi:MAG: hypothetical protein U1F12_07425 [Pseudomonadales bacterium]|jgi:TM2 domain-containing membrane protein YozV
MKKVSIAAALLVLTGCASAPPAGEYLAYEENHVLVEKKSPGLAVALGFLPGGGSFYAGYPGKGVINFLTWPISIFWDPVSGYHGSKMTNYNATKVELAKKKRADIDGLTAKYQAGSIDEKTYIFEKGEIDRKYTFIN